MIQGSVVLWSNRHVYDREVGGSNLGGGKIIYLLFKIFLYKPGIFHTFQAKRDDAKNSSRFSFNTTQKD